MKISFFLGKGGVGKTTLSLLYAFNKGKVAVISLDKAHNLKDALQHFSKEKFQNLYIEEVDIEEEIEKYLENKKKELENKFSFFSIYNLDLFFENLKNAPGIEEEIYLYIIKNRIEKLKKEDYDEIHFDMPPTALSLRILSLPQINLGFLNFLKDIRKKIYERRKIIYKKEKDKVLEKLDVLEKFYKSLDKFFKSSTIYLVLNLDALSFRETELILKKLKEFNFDWESIFLVFNKLKEDVSLSLIKNLAQKYECKDLFSFIENYKDNIIFQKLLKFEV